MVGAAGRGAGSRHCGAAVGRKASWYPAAEVSSARRVNACSIDARAKVQSSPSPGGAGRETAVNDSFKALRYLFF